MDDDFTARAGEYWPRLTRTARLLTGNAADADRRARAAVAEVYARRRIPGDDAEFYVRRALVRGFLRDGRSWGARRPVHSGGARHSRHSGRSARSGYTPEPYAPDPLDPLTEVLAGLPHRRRAVAVLRHWDGLTHREIAALLNSSRGTVKTAGRRAEKALRTHPAYREGAPDVGPSEGPSEGPPLPGPAIEAAGRTLRKRRRRTTAVLTAVGALLLVPLVVGAVRGTGSGSGGVTVSVERAAVRVVTPGERVEAAPGVQFWLSKDGTHVSAPGQPNQFRDAGEDKRGVTLWVDSTTGNGKRVFLSGVHRGPREASRVEVRTAGGTFTARLLTLAGSPGWSAWYVDAQLPGGGTSSSDITVKAYDSAGTLLARTDSPS
ncbi:sigma factor-like helix-turn-helix DNA-binding protein [Streptomyces kroppenstedtii]|uniref:sigma factor-like helix-turn-helix DNA-binding protein n=1 Tax=Streptomyces kroppenstedtii TaxID=3051181 RepID=UPI0028D82DBD|nr:sigma factor-like helix-turn-helix DNA-binding protein [Streptomyces sp. DSM 40484]